MLKLLSNLPQYQIARTFNWQASLPFNYTLGLTYRCNARCKTCKIYEHESVEELTPSEWEKIFRGLGKSPYWITFTGGEPFLYSDLVEVYYDLVTTCKPTIVNIPTNGLLTDRTVDWVWQMAKISPKTKLIINVSLDHWIPSKNDEIRGVRGYFSKATKTVSQLQSIKADNLTVGIHTVVSKLNVVDLPNIHDNLSNLLVNPNNYITEIAENRVELGTMEEDITPKVWQYKEAIECLVNGKGHSIKQAFRKEYYHNVSEWLYQDGHKMPPCYAGYASCQIAPDGEVWFCCIKAESIGNLREASYDFKELWNGLVAQEKRLEYRKCSCPMANVSYTNALFHYPTLLKVIKNATIG